MRLSERERTIIREAVEACFGPHASVSLFGSRLDDGARGGDVDLLVEVPEPLTPEEALFRKLRTVARIQKALEDRKIDLVVRVPGGPEPPILRWIQERVSV